MSVAGLVLLSSALATGEVPADFSYDFRKSAVKPAVLKYMGKGAKKGVQFKPEGVIFTFPDKKEQPVDPIGFGPRFKIRGDFEITAAFEVLQEAEPAPESFGLNLHVYIDTNTTRGATILRSHKPAGKGIQLIAHELTRDSAGKTKHAFHPTDAVGQFKTGKLRLKRTGSQLAYLVAEGNSSLFQQIHETEWTAEDVRMVRIGGTNSKAATPFRFRILTLEITSDEMPTYPSMAHQASSWPPTFLIIGLLVVAACAIGGGIWIWRRRENGSASSE